MKLLPLGSRVLIRLDPPPQPTQQTSLGIFRPTNDDERRLQIGTVVAVGPGERYFDRGELIIDLPAVSVDQRVLLDAYTEIIYIDEVRHALVEDHHIRAVVEEE